MRAERLLLIATPAVAMAAVAVGLGVGAPAAVRAAIVLGAPASAAGTGLAWQVSVLDDDRGVREPASLPDVEVDAQAGDLTARWSGATNEDGVAEVLLALPRSSDLQIEVRAGGQTLAHGRARSPTLPARSQPATAWTRFARREGPVVLDVAVVGQRVASGFPASIWVRATDARTHAVMDEVSIEPERDGSISPASAQFFTDSGGWAHIVATPMGYAVALVLHARARDGRTGEWAGALFVSPGAAQIVTPDRFAPNERPMIDVVFPNLRSTAYLEIDDARGRAWATTAVLRAAEGSMPHASVLAPKLAPGLYWAVAASDPAGGGRLGPGTMVRPFFVAASDESALAFGTETSECASRVEPGRGSMALGACLALAGATAVPRYVVLDGFSSRRSRDARRRIGGLVVAVGAIALAALLETVLLLRAAQRARFALGATSPAEPSTALEPKIARGGKMTIALLVALLGFALLAAFLLRAG